MIPGRANVLVGLQAGSESKGKIGAFLSRKYKPDVICMASCPNSGHTVFIGDDKFVTYHLPVSFVGHRDAIVALGPTSVIYLPILQKEIEMLGLTPENLKIHPRAVMIRDHYMQVEREEGLLKIGSTNQGVGVARREKLMRVEDLTFSKDVPYLQPFIDDTVVFVNKAMNQRATVLCEMTQGFDLDLEHGIDVHFATSKMINPSMGLAEAGIAPSMVGMVYGVLRPYPIRVNNRAGSSGPYAEAAEITWEDVAMRCGYPLSTPLVEITTTTKLPRRVFEFSTERFQHAIRVCRPNTLCLQFANYVDWEAFRVKDPRLLPIRVRRFAKFLETLGGVPVEYIGTGPDMEEMLDLSGNV